MSGMAAAFTYCTVLAAVLAIAAHWLESGARGVDRSGRWAWFMAMVLSLGVPLMAWLGLRVWSSPLPALPVGGMFALPELTVTAEPEATGVDLRTLVVWAWGVGSVLVLAKVLRGVGRLRAAKRGWRAERVSGVDVLVTENVGPAVFGLHRASILLPSWALTMQEDLRALMLLHEREHLRAGDPWVLAGALAMVVLMPWNAALWYQLHRLRLAVEMDCDARVLRRAPDPRRYGRLLLEVGRRRSTPLGVLALSEPVTFLERRIRAFTRRAGPHAMRRALALGASAFCLGSLAVCARDPISPQRQAAVDELAVSTVEPEFTPYTQKPQLKNPAQVSAALRMNYPPLVRDAGIGGTTQVWFFIDAEGRVGRTQIAESSGVPALDDAALRVAELMQFVPAKNRDRDVAVWVQIPITFASSGSADDEASDEANPTYSAERLRAAPTDPGAPHFTPYTVKPRLRNSAEVSRALQREYPPLLRDAGIGGTTVLWFNIGDDGTVVRTMVNNPSGHDELDEAAVRVAGMMEFTPAQNRDESVAVWVLIPLTFSAK